MANFRVVGTAEPPLPLEFIVQLPDEFGDDAELANFYVADELNRANAEPISKLNWQWKSRLLEPSEAQALTKYAKLFKRRKGRCIWVLRRDSARIESSKRSLWT